MSPGRRRQCKMGGGMNAARKRRRLGEDPAGRNQSETLAETGMATFATAARSRETTRLHRAREPGSRNRTRGRRWTSIPVVPRWRPVGGATSGGGVHRGKASGGGEGPPAHISVLGIPADPPRPDDPVVATQLWAGKAGRVAGALAGRGVLPGVKMRCGGGGVFSLKGRPSPRCLSDTGNPCCGRLR